MGLVLLAIPLAAAIVPEGRGGRTDEAEEATDAAEADAAVKMGLTLKSSKPVCDAQLA